MKIKRGKEISAEKWKTGGVIAALVAAVTVFCVMLQVEKSALTGYEKGTVCMAVAEIPKGQQITAENYSEYFVLRDVDAGIISGAAIRDAESLQGLVANYDIDAGTLVTEGMFRHRTTITKGMKSPVIAGFKAEDLYQVVGGVLRAGDRIHIYSVSEEHEAILIWDDIYVQGVFDQAGIQVDNGDRMTAAQRINIYLDKSEVEEFYSELASGTLRVVKVLE